MSKLQDFFNRPVGIFHSVLDPNDPENCARLTEEFGFSCIQWNLPGGESSEDCKHAEAALKAFGRRGLKVVALSAYQNLIAPEADSKEAGLRVLERHLDISPFFPDSTGVATETGTKNPDSAWHFHADNLKPESWDEMIAVLKPLVVRARERGTRVLIEGYVENVVRTATDIARLKSELGTDGLGFVMDPFNLILEEDLPGLPSVLGEVFDAIGSDYGIAHAKDLIYKGGVVDTPRSGTGIFDFQTYFKLLDERLPGVPLVLEHLELSEVGPTLDFLKTQYQTYLQSCN